MRRPHVCTRTWPQRGGSPPIPPDRHEPRCFGQLTFLRPESPNKAAENAFGVSRCSSVQRFHLAQLGLQIAEFPCGARNPAAEFPDPFLQGNCLRPELRGPRASHDIRQILDAIEPISLFHDLPPGAPVRRVLLIPPPAGDHCPGSVRPAPARVPGVRPRGERRAREPVKVERLAPPPTQAARLPRVSARAFPRR